MTEFKVGDKVLVSNQTAHGDNYIVPTRPWPFAAEVDYVFTGADEVDGSDYGSEHGTVQVVDSTGGVWLVFPEMLTLVEHTPVRDSATKITETLDGIRDLLLEKNRAYGDSALDPVRVFSRANTVEQIKVRIDDKISRLARGADTDKVPEDTVRDLIGYCVLLLIAEEEDNDQTV